MFATVLLNTLLLSASLLNSCTTVQPEKIQSENITQVQLQRSFSLKMREIGEISSANFRVQLDSVIEDSRCPKDVVCVWTGNGRVRLLLTLNGNKQPIELNTTLNPKMSIYAGYTVQLLEIAPYPISTRITPQTEYSVQLLISKE